MKIKKVNSNTKNLNLSKTRDDEICKIKFAYCQDKFPLEKLGPKELKAFINFCKKIEIISWKDIKIDQGLNYETPRYFNVSIPDIFPKDATLVSFRANQKFRIIRWRESDNLNLLWFDKNHLSYPC